jgi:hypothetical protein
MKLGLTVLRQSADKRCGGVLVAPLAESPSLLIYRYAFRPKARSASFPGKGKVPQSNSSRSRMTLRYASPSYLPSVAIAFFSAAKI